MPSFQATRWFQRRLAAGRVDASAEAGFLLVEVIISAMLVGMIVVATMTGFNVLDRSTAEQRRRTEATVLAAESQEQMRSDSATTLLSFKGGEHVYTRTVAGTNFTITQKATFGNGSSTTGCNVGEEGSKGKGTYILISSAVTWTVMKGKAVTESSVITPPTGSALEVKVNNGGSTPTSGVTVAISYRAVESTGTTTIEGTTGSGGCVLFAGIPSTSAKLQVRETAGIVNKQGTLKWPEEELTLAPNVLTPHEVVLAPGGSLTATFTYLEATKYKHKQNNPAAAEIEETVTGDTFVAENPEMKLPPNFQTGSNQTIQNFPGGLFEILPGATGSYKPTATTQIEPVKYPKGNLFPFPKEKSWALFAGDCPANDPEEITKSLKTKVVDPSGAVLAGANTTVSVPMTYVQLNVYKSGKSQSEIAALKENAWKELETSNSYPVTLTNVKCEGVKPDNETAINNDHVQATTTGSIWGAHLEAPFQPFGEYEMCLFAAGKTYTVKPYSNQEASAKVTRNIYLGELSKTEKEAARTKSEGETKSKRESEEATTRKTAETKEAETQSKRESEEAPAWTKIANEEKAEKTTKETEEATKAARLAKEKSEKEKWEKELTKKEINSSQKTTKENTQRASREAAESTEKKADEKRKSEESTTKNAKTSQESTRKKAEEKEATTESTRIATEASARKKAEEKEATTESTRIASETTTRKAAETKESETKTAAVKNETEELAAKEVTVESGKSSC